MKIITDIYEMQDISEKLRRKKKSIGFVPTMGYLHDGHKSLMDICKNENDKSIVSIFVNPTQFGPGEDLSIYPRDFEHDKKIAKESKIDYIFFPDEKDMYPAGFNTFVKVYEVSDILEGQFRKNHFQGVCTVIAKLFNITKARFAYFGQKDAQQAFIIKKMAADLNIDVSIKILPTIRDNNGLALSSRNKYLNSEQYEIALNLNKSLRYIKTEFTTKNRFDKNELIAEAKNKFLINPRLKLDYLEICDSMTFRAVEKIKKGDFILIAAKVDNVRLIDNIIL